MANPKTKNILISMMIAMSSAFLIGSILLLSRDAYATNGNVGSSYQYTGYADTREVVSEAVFVESGNLSHVVGNMTVSGENTMNVSKDIVSKPNHKILSGSLDIKTILSGSQVIVGTGVSSSFNNIFVFSNTSSFIPKTPNTFYINATDGLGISGPSTKSGVNVHGIVKVGLTGACNEYNLGAIGMASNGCLVGCARENGNAKWHLIDKSKRCQDRCQKNSSSCETTSPADTTRKLRDGVCTGEVAADSSYKQCGSASRAGSLTGVSFISYFTPACPKQDEGGMVNPCAYTCKNLNDDRCKFGSSNGGGDNPYCTSENQPTSRDGVITGSGVPAVTTGWSYKASGTLGACEWKCDEGYVREGNGCVMKDVNETLCSQISPYECLDGSSATEQSGDSDKLTWKCGAEPCDLECDYLPDDFDRSTLHNGYCANGNVCLGSFKNATLVAGSDKNLTQNVDSKLYEDRKSAGNNKCAYICDNGYTYIRNGGNPQCAICEDGTYNSATKTCTISAQCPTGYKSKNGGCFRIGNCLDFDGKVKNSIPGNSNWTMLRYIPETNRPLGRDEMWKCYEADDPHQVTEDSICEYKCKNGYKCGIYYAVCVSASEYYSCPSEHQCDYTSTKLEGGTIRYSNPNECSQKFKQIDFETFKNYRDNNKEGCYETCNYGYTETTINNKTYCWKKCDKNQYFSEYAGCLSCREGEKPGGTYDNNFESYTQCVNACDSSVCGGKPCGWSDITKGCLLDYTLAICPAGWNKGDNNTCFRCLPGTTWNEKSKKCE